MQFYVTSKWVDGLSSVSHCKRSEISLDGNQDAFNPAELILGELSACMIKGIIRVSPMLDFKLMGIEVVGSGVRQDVPPKMESIDYEIIVDTDESDDRLELLHKNVKKHGTVFNTFSAGTNLNGVL
jgi:uncharacterized OsmC-like protein